jgi:beta-galactosidase
MLSRRDFLGKTAVATATVAASASTTLPAVVPAPRHVRSEILSLCGLWKFRLDPRNVGTQESWFAADHSGRDWQDVSVPHTWQIVPAHADYRGIAWYQSQFDVPAAWSDSVVRVEFEAVFHSATVWVNGQLVGEHLRKGYTTFAFDITPALRRGQPNSISVRVDGAFNEHMLPRGRSSDWGW